ncbi:MAG: twin-arginine translocase TatA/TatE family subunit [Bacteroidales bacterium]|nr:twin-arginine translocase TatA/TatE family subunit [Bacteroidales bacterium]
MNTSIILLGMPGLPEIIIILVIVLLLFGGRKIPELMRGMGKGIRNFKDGMSGQEPDDEEEKKDKDEGNQLKDKK